MMPSAISQFPNSKISQSPSVRFRRRLQTRLTLFRRFFLYPQEYHQRDHQNEKDGDQPECIEIGQVVRLPVHDIVDGCQCFGTRTSHITRTRYDALCYGVAAFKEHLRFARDFGYEVIPVLCKLVRDIS
ncbi:MAG: hypothetical protein JWQ78_1181 [Sediminibacterium sp.]|nr:hypothetical protein [Sediminibacterium sp.]